MNRPFNRLVALLLTMLATTTGCHPTQPFYLHEDGDLSHYLATATEMENPDIEEVSLEEVTQARAPLTLNDMEFTQFRDLTLEECVTFALQNSKVIRNLGSLTQFTIADGLVGRTASSITVYDPSIFETDPQFGVEAALSEFDAQFSTNVFWEKTDRPQNSRFQSLTSALFQRDVGQFDAGITKRSASGTTFAVRNQTIYDSNNSPSRGIGVPSDWYTAMDVEATQPLMRGRGTQSSWLEHVSTSRSPISKRRCATCYRIWRTPTGISILPTVFWKRPRPAAIVLWSPGRYRMRKRKGGAQRLRKKRSLASSISSFALKWKPHSAIYWQPRTACVG